MPRPTRQSGRRLAFGAAVPWWRRARWRLWRWAVVGLVALAAGRVVQSHLSRADQVVAQLGTTRAVVVARRDLEPGHVVADDDGVIQQVPVAVVPDSAVAELPTGRVVTQVVVAGEVLSAERLAPEGVVGLAALVPAGRRAITVPTGDASVGVRLGDRVDVLDPTAGDGYAAASSHAGTVAHDAIVIAVAERSVTLAIDADEASPTAAALGRGNPVLALVGAEPAD